jgi:regulator of sigma E protease
MDFSSLLNLLLLIFGFGFVIFWHELGHFLAAKWAGVKVEQFAVGFGQALLCWRKGLGTTVGTNAPAVQKLIDEARGRGETGSDDAIRHRLGVGETEYRLNWIPLGGYVKMLGQDDMNPNAGSPDPRAYNNKPVGQRMVIISAGVIMNVILAGILFCVLFLWGFRAPSPVVGAVQAGSPAQRAGLLAGDRILRIDGERMHDFTKVKLATALASPDDPTDVVILRDGKEMTLRVRPLKDDAEGGFLQIGVLPAPQLRVPDGLILPTDPTDLAMLSEEERSLRPGDRIVAVNGVPLGTDDSEAARDRDWAVFQQHVQQSFGRPVGITVLGTDGVRRELSIHPTFAAQFGRKPLNFAGLQPRTEVAYVSTDSAARGKLLPGDTVVRIRTDATGDAVDHPSYPQFFQTIEAASKRGSGISIDVIRDGKLISIPSLELAARIEQPLGPDKRGLGVGPRFATGSPVLAAPLPGSTAAKAGFRAGERIVSINGEDVQNWFDVHRLLASAGKDQALSIVTESDGNTETRRLALSNDDLSAVTAVQYAAALPLGERTEIRKTNNPAEALWWGVEETRDLIIQFYVVLKRMLIQQTVSASSMSGPVGIFHHGVRIASRGPDWMIWYLAMISANLAVVNFLPLPIVDGGHFIFLLLEKIRGRPVSQRVMVVTQVVGLALIVGLFLFVTYNDIMRLL